MVDYKDIEFNVIANTMVETGMSGGNKIFIELAKNWARQGMKIVVFTSDVGRGICRSNGLTQAKFVTWPNQHLARRGVMWQYLVGLRNGLRYARHWARTASARYKIVYASSDYWPDSLPAFKMKKMNPRALLIGSLYLRAPNPFRGFRAEGKITLPRVAHVIFWLTQRPIYRKILKKAQLIFVTSQPDKDIFVAAGRRTSEVLTIQGGVDISAAQQFLRQHDIRQEKKLYDACFMGRLHPQKGPLELIEIWRRVVNQRPTARLAMIGHGPLETEVRAAIHKYGLGKNITLFGFKSGEAMYRIFRASRVMLHPAVYDSGGMAAWEGLAWGLPGVGFDLPALRSYYPQGMLKARINDSDGFANLILSLLTDPVLYQEISRAAVAGSQKWDWPVRAKQVFDQMQVMFQPNDY